MGELMTVRECAAYLKIGVRTLRRFYQEQGLPYVKVGTQYRFRPDQVNKWIQDRTEREH